MAGKFRLNNNYYKHLIITYDIQSGLIGRAWSMLFASVGYQVMLYDILPEQLTAALEYIECELQRLEENQHLRGDLNSGEQFKCITTTSDLKELTADAIFIQECIPERIEWKKSLYQQLDDIVEAKTIISSSTSTFMPSLFSQDLKHKENVRRNTHTHTHTNRHIRTHTYMLLFNIHSIISFIFFLFFLFLCC